MTFPDGTPDLSALGSSPDSLSRRPASAPNPLLSGRNPHGYDLIELTPTEVNLIESIHLQLQNRWMRKLYDEDNPELVWDQFAREARERFAEIGFAIDIEWMEVKGDTPDLPGTAAVPKLTVVARTSQVEPDLDQIAHEIRSGQYDGKVGVVREDGTWSEDTKRKQV